MHHDIYACCIHYCFSPVEKFSSGFPYDIEAAVALPLYCSIQTTLLYMYVIIFDPI